MTLGQGNADVVEIIENPDTKMLAPGEIVLINGHQALTHGVTVRLVNKPDSAGPG